MAGPFIDNPVNEEARMIQRAFQDRTNLFTHTDAYLWERYWLSRQSIVYLCSLLEPHIMRVTCHSQSLTTVQSVCIALRFFASGTFLYSVGDVEKLSKASVCREVRAVYLALKQFLNIYITFPGHHDPQWIKETFYAIAGFPNVLGCIDCSHVRIVAPSGPVERDYVDRRNHHSLNLQAKWPGGVHARIFRSSSGAQRLAQREFEGILLGDGGYPFSSLPLTPYSDPGTEAEEAFNGALNSTRFQCLKYVRVAPERACDIMVACAILHNIATIRRERLLDVTLEESWEDPNPMPEDMDGRAARDLYRDAHFASFEELHS